METLTDFDLHALTDQIARDARRAETHVDRNRIAKDYRDALNECAKRAIVVASAFRAQVSK